MTGSAVPPDDPGRKLAVVDPDDPGLRHVAVAGDTYTILVSGPETGGRYCLIDMFVPPGGGPAPHRHAFEEMYRVLEGEVEFTFRGETRPAAAGTTVNVPANAPHSFVNGGRQAARMLCLCAPAGQEEFFLAVGTPVAGRTTPAPEQSEEERSTHMAKLEAVAPRYGVEMLNP